MSKRKSKAIAEESILNSLSDDDSDDDSDDESYDPSESDDSESDFGEGNSEESESDSEEFEDTESNISEESVSENTESIENTESESVFSNTESDISEKTESGTESVFSNTESETEESEDTESGTESDDESVSDPSEPSESEPSEGSDDESEFSEISQSISKIKDESKYDDLKAIDKAIGFWVEGVPYVLVENKGFFSRIYIVGEINKKFHEIKGRLPKASPKWNFIKQSEECDIKNKLGKLTIIFRNLFGVCTISEYKEYKKSIDHQGPFIYDPKLKGGKKILFDAGKKVKKFFIVNPTPNGFRFEIK